MANGRGERVIAANPIPIAGGRVIASPFQFYLEGNDNIRVEGWNTSIGAALQVQGRAIDEFGQTQAFNMVLPLTANRARNVRDYAPVRGYILNMAAVVVNTVPAIGQTFARVSIIRGFTGATIVLGVLLQGYVSTSHGLGWPGSPIVSSIEGPGYTRHITGTTPAVNENCIETVPTGALWVLQSIRAVLTADATGVPRVVGLFYYSAGAQFVGSWQPAPGPVGVQSLWSWSRGLPLGVSLGPSFWNAGTPEFQYLRAGDWIGVSRANAGPGDQFLAPLYTVVERLEVE